MYSIKRYIVANISSKILKGEYPINSKLPSENSLARKFNCSRLTARASLVALERAGIIKPLRGSGYYVNKNAIIVIMLPKFIQNQAKTNKTKVVPTRDDVMCLVTEYYDQNQVLIGIVKWTIPKSLYLDVSQQSEFEINICDYIIDSNVKGYQFLEYIEYDEELQKVFITRKYFYENNELIYETSSWYHDLKLISTRTFGIN